MKTMLFNLKTKREYVATSLIAIGILISVNCGKGGDDSTPTPPPNTTTFTNPLRNGADPWVVADAGTYYYTQTAGTRVNLWKTTSMSKLGTASMVTAYQPTNGAPNSQNVWAPELHKLDNKWYIYYTAGSGPDETQRTWVLENTSADPTTGTWTDKGRIFNTDADFWAIDGTIMQYNGSNYFVWSGRPDVSIQNQNLYIAKMVNPWTLALPTATISLPQQGWEKNGGPVNEAPEHIQRNGKDFLTFSASGCWTDDYALGLLTLKAGGDPLVAGDWIKSAQPVFSKKPSGNAYSPGHNAFFKSKDGTEDWIIYHANSNSNDGCSDRRTIRMQKFTWNGDGSPNFGTPVSTGTQIPFPSGE
jgi:GH43 family beta-xylosidase